MRNRPAEQIILREVDPGSGQGLELLAALNFLGRCRNIEAMR